MHELTVLLYSLYFRPATGNEIHVLITAMDTDGNGTIKFNELASFLVELILMPCHPIVVVNQAWIKIREKEEKEDKRLTCKSH
ncbi:hypothetical protein E2562_038222 [Oryza meyeriana var. granulata]|uniref:EF-hand domain-containing protein n=1 Tax=Oryza meyeriana var. granulata TaxID=110450 RepID=A0A6G1EUA7_9ORYZ|nr:hypothetical protein E2562_038222 [Oryza meyeriana var. granulata]